MVDISNRELRRRKNRFSQIQGIYNNRAKKKEKLYNLEAGSLGRVTNEELLARFHEHNECCCYCGDQLIFDQRHYGKTVKRLTFDHVIPISKGGMNTIENMVPSCQFCNEAKGSDSLENFLGR